MDYICNAINRAGFSVHLVSPSWFCDSNEVRFRSQTTIQLNEQKKITFCPSYSSKIKRFHNIKIILSLLWLFFWLIIHVQRDEIILVYHVQWLSLPIRWAKKIRGFKIILEVEEIYGRVHNNKPILNLWEKKLLLASDTNIAVSDVLAQILGDKVQAVVYGNYIISETRAITSNGKINVVYAGLIDHMKGGAFNSVKCAGLLPDNYLVNICGFGDHDSIAELENEISKLNADLSRISCRYLGNIPDQDFSKFLHSCQIAINPQFDGENMTTLFPSKIIKYLAHNLRVVSTRIKSIEKSSIGHLVKFSENDTPESVANAILQLDLKTKYDSIEVIHN